MLRHRPVKVRIKIVLIKLLYLYSISIVFVQLTGMFDASLLYAKCSQAAVTVEVEFRNSLFSNVYSFRARRVECDAQDYVIAILSVNCCLSFVNTFPYKKGTWLVVRSILMYKLFSSSFSPVLKMRY